MTRRQISTLLLLISSACAVVALLSGGWQVAVGLFLMNGALAWDHWERSRKTRLREP